MSTIFDFRRALIAQLKLYIPEVPVVYVTSPESRLREAIHLGDSVDASIEDPTLKSGVRSSDMLTDHYIEITAVRSYPEDAERYADEILEKALTVITDPTYMDVIKNESGILWVSPESLSMSTQIVDDLSAMTVIQLRMRTFKRRYGEGI